MRERLLADGYREMADVIGTELQVNVRVNGRYPYRLVCRIERDGVLHEYRSDLLPVNPGLPPGSRVPVYLDRYDPHKYYVDVDTRHAHDRTTLTRRARRPGKGQTRHTKNGRADGRPALGVARPGRLVGESAVRASRRKTRELAPACAGDYSRDGRCRPCR